MANKDGIRSSKQVLKSTIIQLQTNLVPAEMNKNSSSSKKKKTAASAKTKILNQKKSGHKRPLEINVENGVDEQQKKWCHQCRSKRDRVVECKKCQSKKYCVACITKWYLNVSEEEFVKACPVCCNNCNCKACLRGFSSKDMQEYSCSEPDKIQYSKHILQKVFPLVRSLNEEQLMEKEIEAKVKGVSISELELQDAECEVDDAIFCDNCGSYFFDFYRSCTCGYDLCLVCCRELRDRQLQGMTCWWKAHIDGSIPCPPKDIGGCDNGILELKRIMPIDWVANMLEKAKEMYKISTSYDIPQTSNSNETVQEKSNASYFYSISAKDIQPQDMQHFQFHWLKGEPIIVNDVLSTSSGLSWEPMVLWRAFRDITKSRNDSHAYELKAINCLGWSEVNIDLYKFFWGYSEGQFKKKGLPLILKLEDWQPSCLSQGEWPRHFVEFINCLPFKDYTNPNNGYLNVAVKLPDLSLKPDMGPRMDIAYGVEDELEFGDSVTKLHYDKSDTVNILTHTKSCVLTSTKLNKTRMVEKKHVDQDEALVSETNVGDLMEGGALWDIFQRKDVTKLEEYLRNHSEEFRHTVEQVFHSIHDRAFYLNMEHKQKLKEEFGIEPWTFKQKLGDAVFVPAGCPYQVRNFKSCTKVELNFISPESLGECIRLQHELRMLPNNHRAKQQKLNIGKMMIYALDHAVADLSGVIDSNGPIDDLQDQFAKMPEILNSDINVNSHTNGWVCDSESDDNSQETSSVFHALSPSVNHTVDHQPAAIEDSGTSEESLGLWQGNDVGPAAKELLQAVDHRYPDTFQGVRIRSKPHWLSILKELHVFIKGFLETSVNALTEDRISSLQADLNDFERFGFNLLWARKRLDMVKNLKFGNDPLRQELVVLEESVELLHKELVEANERLKKASLDYDSVTDARNKKARQLAQKFGAEYDDVLKGHLGFGMLPGYVSLH